MTAHDTRAFSTRQTVTTPVNRFSDSEVFTPKRVIAQLPVSAWVQALSNQFKKLNDLSRGWDGYNGQPIDFHCSRFTEQVLDQLSRADIPEPSLVPLSNGRLQFEWHMNQYDLEVEVQGPLDMLCYRYDHLTDEEEEIELSADLLPLRNWLDELASRNL